MPNRAQSVGVTAELGEPKKSRKSASRGSVSNSQCPGGVSRRILLSKVTVVNSDNGIHPARGWGLIPVSIANYAIGLTFTASASLIAIAQFGSRGSGPKDTAKLAQTLDQQLKKNHQLLESNRQIGEIASLRNNPLAAIPVSQVETLDHLTDKNQQLQKENRELVGEVAAVRNKLAGPSEARTKVKVGKTIAKIAAWLLSCVQST